MAKCVANSGSVLQEVESGFKKDSKGRSSLEK